MLKQQEQNIVQRKLEVGRSEATAARHLSAHDDDREHSNRAGESLTFASGKASVAADGSSGALGLAGLKFLTQMAADLSRGPVDLPCFPNVVIKIRDALNNPKVSIEQTVTLVGAEPRLAARLIQTANSAALNPSGNRVTELRTAITRLGQQLVQSAAMAFAVQQMKDEPTLRSIAEPLKALWKESIAVACISQVIARRTKVTVDEAFLAGLLHGIGRLYIMAHGVSEAPETRRDLESDELIAGWHPSIGKAVLENWKVGEATAAAVAEQFDYDRPIRRDADLTDILIASVVLGDVLTTAPEGPLDIEGINSFRALGLTPADCKACITHASCQLGSLQDALGIH